MKLDQNIIKEILLKENYIDKADVEKADEFVKNKEGSFLDYFTRNGLITTDLLGQALAENFKVPYADLNTNIPTKDLVLEIPEETAKKFRVILFKKSEDIVTVTTDEPLAQGIEEELQKIFTGKKISICFSLSDDIDSLLLSYKKPLNTRFDKIITQSQKVAPEIIDEIVDDAISLKASDIHFDPQEEEVVIRFRVDGFLHEAARIPKKYYENILNRVKVQADMKTDGHSSSQDGAIRYEINGETIDTRVSVMPTLNGEKIVIRLLAEHTKSFALDDLGFSKEHQKLFLKAAKRPFGMILVTGPTGCGKTTTLYALLKYLNNPGINISTIEDPVEYKIPGVNHIQVNNQTNITFAEGLRSIIRQDPDVILVGEIRDRETAEISVNAALTGHLLFSTFHANDASSVIPRFLEMGVEPSLLSSTLKLVVAQRLVRKVCEKCRHSYKVSIDELSESFSGAKSFFNKKEVTLYKGKGCSNCSDSGYKGRTGIFEMIEIGPDMEELILKNPSAQQIWQVEKKKGVKPIFIDGLEKVISGVTTMDELLRVSSPPEDDSEAPTQVEEILKAPKKEKK